MDTQVCHHLPVLNCRLRYRTCTCISSVYMKCVQVQIRSAETTATGGVLENDMQSFTSR